MGIFKLRKNKKYSYTPRYYKSNEDGSSPFEIKHKFDDQRKTIGSNGLKSKFTNVLDELKEEPNREANRRILIIVAVLLLVFLAIIEFDLSIFFS
jgi:hypothetical protein